MRLFQALPVDAVGFGCLLMFCIASFFTIWGTTSRRHRAPWAMFLAFVGAVVSLRLVAQPSLLEVAVVATERGRMTGLTAALVSLPIVGAVTALGLRMAFARVSFNPSTLSAFAFAISLSAILTMLFWVAQLEGVRAEQKVDDVLTASALLLVFPIVFAAFSLGYAAFEDQTGDEDYELLALWQGGLMLVAFMIVLAGTTVGLATVIDPARAAELAQSDTGLFWRMMTIAGWGLAFCAFVFGLFIRSRQPTLYERDL